METSQTIVRRILVEQFKQKVDGRELLESTAFKEHLNMDSLDLLALAAALEDVYGQPLLDESTDPEVFTTIGTLAAHLTSVFKDDTEQTHG